MISTFERQKDILKLIAQLDITPTMYRNTVEKYHAIADFLDDCGIEADMYPQGSFAFGTVVRPSAKDPDANYDLDFICQLKMDRDQIAPSELRRRIENALTSSNRYGGKLEVCEECFTIQYADINGVGFTIDIVPAVDESLANKLALMSKSNRSDLISSAIAIPRHNGERNYSWLTNNPKGFKRWFDEINTPFLIARRDENRRAIFEANQRAFSSVEEIPVALERSALQRVIQILKYHRDTYYAKRLNGDDLKPISAILNTLAAGIAKSTDPSLDVFSLLSYVLDELNIYAEHMQMRSDMFRQLYGSRAVISHNDGKWVIQNPADPGDNLADKWNANPAIPQVFFNWVSICRNDLIKSLSLPDAQFRASAANAFGIAAIQKNWGSKYQAEAPKPINTATASKPYRCL